MDNELLRPTDVDLILAYPEGRTLKLARKNLIPYVQLPDGEIRFEKSEINRLIEQGKQKICQSTENQPRPGVVAKVV